jgi:rubrerythrin
MTTSTEAAQAFVCKMVSKAIQSEELAAAHYRRLAVIAPDDAFERRTTKDAREEIRHADALRRAAHLDGLEIKEVPGWDPDLDGVRAAFEACASRGDITACLFIQDVFLEEVAIAYYDILARTAARVGALSLASLIEKSIIPDERLHIAHGLRDIARRVEEPAERAEAFRRAAREILPAMRAISALPATQPCITTCRTCSDHCLKVDACCGEVSFDGTWKRILDGITDAALRVGVGRVAA